MSDIVVRQATGGVPEPYSSSWIDLVKKQVAKDATDDELKLFLYHCKKTGLDPLQRQIYFQKRRSKNGEQMTILTGIDGYRLTAQRTGEYAGNDDPIFDNEENPRKATVTVYRFDKRGGRVAFSASARWDQYYPGDTQGFMWRKMPHLMLGKCAEALALRKAFPQELGNVYTKEEMEQAVTIEATPIDEEQEAYNNESPIQRSTFLEYTKAEKVLPQEMPTLAQQCIGVPMKHLRAAVKEFVANRKPELN